MQKNGVLGKVSVIGSVIAVFAIICYMITSSAVNQTDMLCSSIITSVSQNFEYKLSSTVAYANSYIRNSDALLSYLQGKQSDSDHLSENSQLPLITALSGLKNGNNCIQDIFIMDTDSDTIISSNGAYSYDEFFSNVYLYEKYPYVYWAKFSSFSRASHIVLSPTKVAFQEQTLNIIPITLNPLNSAGAKNIIINFSIDSLKASNMLENLSDNSKMFILNRYTGDVLCISDDFNPNNQFTGDDYTKLTQNQSAAIRLSGKKGCAFVQTPYSENSLCFTYFITVAYGDIYRVQLPLLSALFVFFLLLAFIMVHALKTQQLKYNVILTSLGGLIGEPGSYERITSGVKSLLRVKSDYNTVLPFLHEKVLFDCMFAESSNSKPECSEQIIRSLPFQYDYFAVIIFQIYPKNTMFEDFSLNECTNIFSGIKNIISSLFNTHYDSLFAMSKSESVYIILNSPSPDGHEEINTILKELFALLQYDNEYINLFTGISSFHKSLTALNTAYSEALSKMKHIPFSSAEISFPPTPSFDCLLSKSDEANLTHSIEQLDIEPALNIINNINLGVSNVYTIKILYFQVITIILKVFRSKKIYNSELFNSCNTIMDKSCNDMYALILELLSLIDSHKTSLAARTNGSEIIDYINENFLDGNMSLETLSQKFGLTSGYISQLIKESNGINFREYLLNLRLNHAKSLLSDTEKSINDIVNESGFYSKQTFFRCFKNNVGITPSEFRKNMTKKPNQRRRDE